ncbi:hypothetical protein EJ08DRAFT_702190 [Tothia fuscella]|uniref:Uncharacterized protein n=1 Tax=Tothia fuscella TaxID=1048955 RepID=A0A9P4NGT0_9PEZI|nr:hypothetical protein EJ08DRAFT_702190 [Tothia fuscella]
MSLVKFVSTSITLCPNLSSNVIIAGYSLALWNESLSNIHPCGGNTYLRPDAGGALQPYPWTFLQILVHAPVCIVRLARFETTQIWSLCVAALNIGIAIQAYKSTGLSPAEVLVWTPVALILDAGAMLQIHILILEQLGDRNPLRRFVKLVAKPFRPFAMSVFESLMGARGTESREQGDRDGQTESQGEKNGQEMRYSAVSPMDVNDPERANSTITIVANATQTDTPLSRPPAEQPPTQTKHGERGLTTIASLALLMFLFILVIQIFGLAKAVQGTWVSNLNATWCSPDFQPGALAVIDGNCNVRHLNESSSSGIGCVWLPAFQQKAWLTNTIVILSISLVLQLVDLCVLSLSDGRDKIWHSKVKLQRPWLTTFAGMIILVVLANGGVNYANSLPDGITARVLVLRRDESLDVFPVCEGRLVSPGLRGAIIGYFDGLLNSWSTWYYGKNSLGA